MVLSSKVALCISGAAAVMSGGFFISYLMKREPKVITLEDSSVTKPDTGKWGNDYDGKNNLVADISDNEAWGNWKYRYTFRPFVRGRKRQSQLDDHFKNVKLGYSEQEKKEDNRQTSLNKACWEAYGKEKTSVTDGGNFKNNIKEFCSTNRNNKNLPENKPK